MGSRVTRAAAHLPAEEVKRRMQRDPRFWCRQRWLIIYQALIAPRKAEEIAAHTGVSVSTVRRVISTDNRLGVAAVETPGTGGRRHEYLTLEQERAFLAPFFARVAAGEIATAAEIQQAFEALVQHPVHPSTIFRLLNRHAWRKLVPRPIHPKADPAEPAEFQTTSQRRSEQLSPPAPQTMSDRYGRGRKMRGALAGSVSPDAPGRRLECGPVPGDRWCGNTPMSLPPSRPPRGK